MKKVLIIGHFWPYRGGSKRIIGLAKYLKEFDWEPIVLTAPLNGKPNFNIRYIETDYRNIFGIKSRADWGYELKKTMKDRSPLLKSFLRIIYRYFCEILAYPDENRYWKVFAMNSINKLLKNEKIDAVISVWPVTSHLIAKEIKDSYKIPWIADFPDLWTQNYNYSYSSIRKIFDRNLELKTIKSADALTTVSSGLAYRLKELHKGKNVYSVPHGFDPEKVNNPPAKMNNKFTITYTGQIYSGKQDPSKILIALKELIMQNIINPDKIKVRMYGSIRHPFDKEIKKYKLSRVVEQYGEVSHEESIKKQQESHLLLLFNWEDRNQKGVYTGKIFEYLAARRPILAIGGTKEGVVGALLKKTNAGMIAPDIEDAKKAIKSYYSEYEHTGQVMYRGKLLEINKYSVIEMAKKFAEILNRIC